MDVAASATPVEKDPSDSPTQLCHGCNLPIIDRFLLKVLDKLWHDQCLRCCRCRVALKEKCFSRDSNIYCKQDFYKVYGVQCAGCHDAVYPSDLIRRVGSKVFHMSCLKCFQCGQEVSTGDHLYILKDGTFLCKTDYNYHEHSTITNHNNNSSNKGSSNSNITTTNNNHNTCNNSSNSSNSSNGNKDISRDFCPTTIKVETNVDEEEDKPFTPSKIGEHTSVSDEEEEPNRRRGPRTTIKAKQLEVLKSAFLATPKPSRHIREKLAEDTGLTMRVIQVWFQNRRSKERRVKQLSVQDARRGLKKGKEGCQESINYPFFHNPQSIADAFHQRRFTFNLFGNSPTASCGSKSTLMSSDESCNGNPNLMPISLPMDPGLMRKNYTDSLLKTPLVTNDTMTDFSMVESFTSQLQENSLKSPHTVKSFSPPARSTYERL